MRLNEHEEAAKAFSAARSVDGRIEVDRGRVAGRRAKMKSNVKDGVNVNSLPPLLFQSSTGKAGKKAITGGDPRLAAVVREDALKSANSFD